MFGERGRAIDLVRQKNDEVQLPAGIRNRDCRIIRSLRVTDALKSFVHHRHVGRRGALDWNGSGFVASFSNGSAHGALR